MKLLQANRFESSYGKQRVLNTGWLCMYFGSFLTQKADYSFKWAE